ncbi:MAG: transposase [Desulfuromonadales bacterium]|nr:transposase [Desulfuromonadales bacterium]
MSHTFRKVDLETLFLLPPSLDDWLPEGHLARFLCEVTPLFVQILLIAHQMNVLKLGKVSLDGTKIKANASKHSALSWKHACTLEKQLKAEVEDLLRQAEEADRAVLPDGLDIPVELARREKRLAAIAAAKIEIERRATERYTEEQADFEKKLATRKDKEQKNGKKAGCKKPKPPEPGPRDKDQVNLTDEESRIMPSSGNAFEQCYNAQASVDVDTMLVVGQHLSQNPKDKLEIEPALEVLNKLPEGLGTIDALLADAGYFIQNNVDSCLEEKTLPYISNHRDGHNQSLKERFAEPPPLPENADAVTEMKHRLKTKDGRAIYAKRKCTVEPVFGIIKAIMGFRQFLLRGVESVRGEWNLVCMAWNLKRMHALAA